jgi:uncharacterized protein (DUF2132 family)
MTDDAPAERAHPKDPLHGVTLQKVLEVMVERHGWHGLAMQIRIRCFEFNPSIKSSLNFLRKTPWAREKLEQWYVYETRLKPRR